MAIGSAMTATVPTVGVDTDAVGQGKVVAFITEAKALLEASIGVGSIDISTSSGIKHGPRTVTCGVATQRSTSGSPVYTGGTTQYWEAAGASDEVTIEIAPPSAYERITAVTCTGRCAGVTAWTAKLYKKVLSTGVVTQVGSTLTSGTAAAIETLTLSSLTETCASGTYYFLIWTSGAASNRVSGYSVTYDKAVTT